MTAVYLVQSEIGTDWANSWYPTVSAAKAEIISKVSVSRLFKVYIGQGRQGLCEVLNLAEANYMNLDCELVGVYNGSRQKA